MIDVELWRARIGLYHAASASRGSKRLKSLFQTCNLSNTAKWASKDSVDGMTFALRSCIAAVSLLLVIRFIRSFIKSLKSRKIVLSFVEASFRPVKAVLISGLPLLLKVCVVMIPLLLLLAGDVERNPGPTEGTTVIPEHVPALAALLHKVAAQWDLLINQLQVPSYIVDQIKYDEANKPELAKRCLLSGLQHWVSNHTDPTYEKIATVLRSELVTNKSLADEVEAFAERIREERKMEAKGAKLITGGTCGEGSDTTREKTPLVPFGCACGKCPAFATDKCPSPSQITFPIMSRDSLSKSEIDELRSQTLDISKKFNKLVLSTVDCLQRSKTSPADVSFVLAGLDLYTPIFKGGKQLMLQEVYDDVENAPNLRRMMAKLKPYFSFFDFHIVETIINECCIDDSNMQLHLENYKVEFSEYISRRIYELPEEISDHNTEDREVIVKLDSSFDACDGSHLKQFQKRLAKILQVSSSGILRLRTIKPGCFELTFELPSFAADAIFPLSKTQESELEANHILRLSCGGFHWPHASCQDSLQSLDANEEPDDDGDEGSLAVHIEHVEVVSKGDPHEENADEGDSAYGTSLHTGTISDQTTTSKESQSIGGTFRELRLLKERDEVDAKRKDKPQLHLLAYEGDLDSVKSIVESENGNPESLDDYGMTPLHKAAFAGHTEVARYLIQNASCHPVSRGNMGRTPLHIAAMYGHLDVVKYLIEEERLEPLCEDDTLCTPLHSSIFYGHFAVTKYLASEITKYQSVKVNDLRIKDELSPLHLAANDGHLDIAKYLASSEECDPNICDNSGYTPLHYAAIHGHISIVKYLVEEQHANVMCTGSDEFTPLHFAATKGQISVVKYLAKLESCDVISTDPLGHTPLHCAAINGHLNVVEFLVCELNEDVTRTNINGASLLHMAAQQGHLDIMKFLVEVKHCNPMSVEKSLITPLHIAAQEGELAIVNYLLRNGCEPTVRDDNGRIPLDYAALKGQLEVVKVLSIGTSPNHSGNNGRTAVHYAAQKGHLDAVKYLVDVHHWNPLHPDSKLGTTPLHVAANEGHLNVVRYFIREKNCDPLCSEALQNTPFHLAAFNGHLDVVKFYIEELHTSPDVKGVNDMNALQLAIFAQKHHVVKYLALSTLAFSLSM